MFDTNFPLRSILIVFIFVCIASLLALKLMRQDQIVRPDQEWILFACGQPGEDSDLYRMLPDGSEITQLTSDGDSEVYPHWVSKSGWIYFWNGYGGGPDIRRIRFDGTKTQTFLTDVGSNGFDIALSEDLLVFSRLSRPASRDIYILRIKNGDPTVPSALTNSSQGEGRNESPVFSPDEQWIAYISARDDSEEIYMIKTDGSEKTPLTTTSEKKSTPAWSPDGKQIIFASGTVLDQDIFSVDILTHEIRGVVSWQGSQGQPSWSPDGEWIVFSSSNDVNSELFQIYKMRLDGSGLQQLTHMNCSAGTPEWIAP